MMLLETCTLLSRLRGTYRTARLQSRAPSSGSGCITFNPVRVWSMLLSGSRVSYFTTGSSSSSSGGVVSTDTLPTKCIVLSDLSYIAVTGTDARRFLQGICTNDISKLKPAAGDCVATSLLNNKGRILFNLLLYTLRDKNVRSSEQHLLDNNNSSVEVSDGLFLLAELHTHNVAEFQRYLNWYKLRSKVDIRSLEADCLFISNTFSAHQLASLNDCSPDVLVAAIDPRLEGFGTRVVINKNALHSLSPQTKELLHIRDRDDESADSGGDSRLVRWYHRYKILRGVLDGPEALSMLPFECNLDALNYVSFSKGCYIGQELMARTKFKGVVRKRLLPFIYSAGGGHIDDLQREVLSEDYDDDDGVAAVVGGSLGPQQQRQSERSGPALGDAIYLSQEEASPRERDDTDSDEAISCDDKPVGKVVYLDPTGTVGLAMMQLSAVATSGSDTRSYQLIAGKKEATSIDLDPNHCEAASHIHLQLPSWFHRLDRVSGNIH